MMLRKSNRLYDEYLMPRTVGMVISRAMVRAVISTPVADGMLYR